MDLSQETQLPSQKLKRARTLEEMRAVVAKYFGEKDKEKNSSN